MKPSRQLRRFIDATLRNKRPRGWPASDQEARIMKTAAMLSSAKPGASMPAPDFVESLRNDLRHSSARPRAGDS
jgi:hypothetical protein